MIAAHSPASAVANTTSSSRSRQVGIKRFRCHQRERVSEQLNGRINVDRALPELAFGHVPQLVQQLLRRDEGVLTDAVLEEFVTGAARDEGGDEHVRVEEKPHETRENTSSSVKMP